MSLMVRWIAHRLRRPSEDRLLKSLDAIHSQCPEHNAGWNRGEPEDGAAIMLVEAIPAFVALSANGKSAA